MSNMLLHFPLIVGIDRLIHTTNRLSNNRIHVLVDQLAAAGRSVTEAFILDYRGVYPSVILDYQ